MSTKMHLIYVNFLVWKKCKISTNSNDAIAACIGLHDILTIDSMMCCAALCALLYIRHVKCEQYKLLKLCLTTESI